jgi:hypothetical protein
MKKIIITAMTLSVVIAFNSNSAFAHEDEAAHKKAAAEHKHAADGSHVDEHKHTADGKHIEEKSKEPADSHGHSHTTKIPDTVEDIWKKIHKQQAQLVRLVDEKKLSSAHDPAFVIRDLVKALPGKVAAESKVKAEEGAKEIAKLAAAIDKSSAAGAQKTTEANAKKMGEAIASLQAKLQPGEVKKQP